MSAALPARPNLEWLKKAAKQHLSELRANDPAAKLAAAQLGVARHYGFASWSALKQHVDSVATRSVDDAQVAAFLQDVGAGNLEAIRRSLAQSPALVNAVGPHPYWGGRPQPLHVAIETHRRDVFELLLAADADVNGDNAQYDLWSPLMLTYHWDEGEMRSRLLAQGARIGLIEALLAGDDALTLRMLATGRSALPQQDPNGGSILAFARTTAAIDRLVELGASLELQDRWQTTPIEALSRLGPRGRPLVLHLLRHGAKASPQEYARVGDQQTLETLLDADPRLIDSDDILIGAVDFGHESLVEWLLARGANPNARSSIGSQGTALHSAAWEGNLSMTKILVAAGADVRALDREHHNTPAGWARVAVQVTNNPDCAAVAAYLEQLVQGSGR